MRGRYTVLIFGVGVIIGGGVIIGYVMVAAIRCVFGVGV